VRDDLTCEIDRAQEVRFKRALPFFESRGKKTLSRWASGIGHANVNATKLLCHLRNKLFNGPGVCDVECLSKNLSAILLSDLLRGELQGLLVPCAHRYAAALGGKRLRRGAANPLTRRSHQRDTIFSIRDPWMPNYKRCAALRLRQCACAISL